MDELATFHRIEQAHRKFAHDLATAKLARLTMTELRVLYRHYAKVDRREARRPGKTKLVEIVAEFFIDDHEHNPDALDY